MTRVMRPIIRTIKVNRYHFLPGCSGTGENLNSGLTLLPIQVNNTEINQKKMNIPTQISRCALSKI